MKQLSILLLAIALIFSSCSKDKDDSPPPNDNPSDNINITSGNFEFDAGYRTYTGTSVSIFHTGADKELTTVSITTDDKEFLFVNSVENEIFNKEEPVSITTRTTMSIEGDQYISGSGTIRFDAEKIIEISGSMTDPTGQEQIAVHGYITWE